MIIYEVLLVATICMSITILIGYLIMRVRDEYNDMRSSIRCLQAKVKTLEEEIDDLKDDEDEDEDEDEDCGWSWKDVERNIKRFAEALERCSVKWEGGDKE